VQCMSAFMTRSVVHVSDNQVNQPVAGSSQTDRAPSSEDRMQASDHAESADGNDADTLLECPTQATNIDQLILSPPVSSPSSATIKCGELKAAESELSNDPGHGNSSSVSTTASSIIDIFKDAGLWPMPMTASVRTEIVNRGPTVVQNKDGPFAVTERIGCKTKGSTRFLTSDWFYHNLENGEKVLRSWMIYSVSDECLYCFCCRLFGKQEAEEGRQRAFVSMGFRAWWKLNPKVSEHKNSPDHVAAFQKWTELEIRRGNNTASDALHQQQRKDETKKRTELLRRVLE
jgi:hypothetical protein